MWLLFYFTQYPKIVTSSQKVKEELRKYVPNYSENMDVVTIMGLNDKHVIAINNVEKYPQNKDYKHILDRNPYTEIPNLIMLLFGNSIFNKEV